MMKRRNALWKLSLLAGGSVLSLFGLKWVKQNSQPDLRYLISSKYLLVSLVDTIIPKTDTPSASECNVHEFIVKLVTDCTETKSQNNFINGLKELEEFSSSHFQKSFSMCSDVEKKIVLNHFEERDNDQPAVLKKVKIRFFGKSFFATLREYCGIGYFLSELGATQALRYSHIPSKYIPCQPYVKGDRGWATF